MSVVLLARWLSVAKGVAAKPDDLSSKVWIPEIHDEGVNPVLKVVLSSLYTCSDIHMPLNHQCNRKF